MAPRARTRPRTRSPGRPAASASEPVGELINGGQGDLVGARRVALLGQALGVVSLRRDLSAEHVGRDHGVARLREAVGVGHHVVVQAPPRVQDDNACAGAVGNFCVCAGDRVAVTERFEFKHRRMVPDFVSKVGLPGVSERQGGGSRHRRYRDAVSDMTTPRLRLTRDQILRHRRAVGFLDERMAAGPESLRRAAWAGLQDSMPRAALLSIHARVEGAGPATWEDPSLVQLWGPRYSTYVVARSDIAVFTLGRLPDDARGRRGARTLRHVCARSSAAVR